MNILIDGDFNLTQVYLMNILIDGDFNLTNTQILI